MLKKISILWFIFLSAREFIIKYLLNPWQAEELGCIFEAWHCGHLKRRWLLGAAGGKCCSIFIWKSYWPFPMESPVHRDTITFPELPCKVHSSPYWFLTMSAVYQRREKPIMSCSQQRNPHELLQDPLCLGTAGKTQNNCFGNDRGSSFLDFIFPKVIYSFLIYDFLSGHVVQSRAITGLPGKIKNRMRCHCQQSSLSSLQMGLEELLGKILKQRKKVISWMN